MEILKYVWLVVGALLMMAGVIMVYDARKLTEKWFGFGDRNDAVKWLKIIGFLLCIGGGILIAFQK